MATISLQADWALKAVFLAKNAKHELDNAIFNCLHSSHIPKILDIIIAAIKEGALIPFLLEV